MKKANPKNTVNKQSKPDSKSTSKDKQPNNITTTEPQPQVIKDTRTPLEKKAHRLLKNNGMLDGYKYVLANACKDGLPQGDIFEYAAYLFGSYEKIWKKQKSNEVKEKIMKYKEDVMKKKLVELDSHENSVNKKSASPNIKNTDNKNNLSVVKNTTGSKTNVNNDTQNKIKNDSKLETNSKISTETDKKGDTKNSTIKKIDEKNSKSLGKTNKKK